MPDRKKESQNRIPRLNKYLKSGIIHDWAKLAPILIFFLQNGGPLGGATLGARQKSKQYAIVDICANFRAFGRI